MPERPPPHVELLGWTVDAMKAQALVAAADLGVADVLADGPRSCHDIAEAVSVNESFLYRLLRALAGYGVFEELEGRRFQLNELASALRTDAQPSVRDWVRVRGASWLQGPWGAMTEAVRTGRSGWALTMEEGVFEYFEKNPDDGALFDRAMVSVSTPTYHAVAEAYDFGVGEVVVDIGGGAGGQLMAVASRSPNLQCILADLPSVVERSRAGLEAAGFADRIRCEGIDMFAAAPSGGDVYMMGNVIHDWGDDESVKILSNCVTAMNRGGRVALVEQLVPPPNTPHLALAIDLEMLVMTDGGRKRTLEEFKSLFQQAGLQFVRVVETAAPWCVIEGVKA